MTVPVCAGAVVFSYLGAMVNSMVDARMLTLIIALTIVFAGAYILLPTRLGGAHLRDGKSTAQQLLLLAWAPPPASAQVFPAPGARCSRCR